MTHRVALLAQNPGLPFVFEAAGRVGAVLTLVVLPGVRIPDGLPNVESAVELDLFGDPDGTRAWLERQHASWPFDAVVTLFDAAGPFTAVTAARLGLRGVRPEAARICRDKYRQREAMREAGLDVPGYRLIDPVADLGRQVADLRFPLVVKPVSGWASFGVTRADNLVDLKAAVDLVQDINSEQLAPLAAGSETGRAAVLVEEFVDGPEYCVEAISDARRTTVLAITDKGNLRGPYFEERTFITPAPLAPGIAARITDAVLVSHRQIGIDFGASHTELRLRADGTPVLLEIGARMGGSGTVHYLVETATGIDFLGAVLHQAIHGELGELRPAHRCFAGDWIMPVIGSGVYAGLAGADEVRRHEATRMLLELMRPGTAVPAWPRWIGYPAFVLSAHASYEDCKAYHAWLEDTMKIAWTGTAGPAGTSA
ncbi:MAG TPA: ATP-grasp domain-containing protein [Streptosporangiaceae bacterium]|nr:ATP-grasp domain-containing protein [Streptosporangiaceae bacterium]